MGTKVQCESYYPGYSSMLDLNDDSNSCSWPLYHGDKTFTNGQYYNGFLPGAHVDSHPGYEKDAVKHKMLEHEAVFKKQLYELHRLYRIQRDLMDEFRMKRTHQNQISGETSLSSSHVALQVSFEDAQKWHISSFPWVNTASNIPSTSGFKEIPVCSTKVSSSQASPVQSQNGCNSKDFEILDSRPAKVRRKIDLRLPADEYIDNDEKKQDRNETYSHSCGINHKTAPEAGTNKFLDASRRNLYPGEALLPESFLRKRKNVDLNVPIDVEETNASACLDLQGREPWAEQKLRIMDFPKEANQNSYHNSDNGTLSKQFLSNVPGKNWFSHVLDPGYDKKNLRSVSQGLQSEKPATTSHPTHVHFNERIESSTLSIRESHQLRERSVHGFQLSDREHDDRHLGSVCGSHLYSPYIISSSSLPKLGSHSLASWEKYGGSSGQRAIAHQQHPHLNSSTALSRSCQSSSQSRGVFGDRWKCDNAASNTSCGDQMPYKNAFYHASPSLSKEPEAPAPLCHYDHRSYNNLNNAASERFNGHVSGKPTDRIIDLSGMQDCKSNGLLSNSSCYKMAPEKAHEVIDLERTQEDHLTLPWLKAKPVCENKSKSEVVDLNTVDSSFLHSSLSHLSHKKDATFYQIDKQNMKRSFCSDVEASRTDVNVSRSCRKILGFPIFGKPEVPKNESSFTSPSVPPQASVLDLDDNKKPMVVDINLPCELAVPDINQQSAAEVEAIKNEDVVKVSNFRHEIDLNTCMNEDEDSLIPDAVGSSGKTTGIDLEAPPIAEGNEDACYRELSLEKGNEATLLIQPDEADSHQNELVRTAAEAIVAFTASAPHYDDNATCIEAEASVVDSLGWFADIVFSCSDNLSNLLGTVSVSKQGEDDESFLEEIDYFESMTLKLIETKKEDYMPKPLVLENPNLEEAPASALPTRTRRGPPRRGRQQRNFQRDILPGLASLSRHEVTEDLQTFDGLMRATGQSWQSGLTRRNLTRKGGRGRRRSVTSSPLAPTSNPPGTPLIQKLCNMETGLEERSLRGWGKTTRRPRRQRSAAGNPPCIPLA